VEVAKALGGSFKLVTLAPKTVREMTRISVNRVRVRAGMAKSTSPDRIYNRGGR